MPCNCGGKPAPAPAPKAKQSKTLPLKLLPHRVPKAQPEKLLPPPRPCASGRCLTV